MDEIEQGRKSSLGYGYDEVTGDERLRGGLR
jgi:hypothetical protein